MLKHLWKTHFCYSPNKGQVRVFIKDETEIATLKGIEGVQYVLSASTLKTLANNTPKQQPKGDQDAEPKQRPSGNLLVIKRIDATPISPAQAAILSKLLNLTKPSVKDGALLGLSKDAQALSGTLINGKFLVGWEVEM